MRGHNEQEIISHLPPSLQTEIARHLHSKMIESVAFFRDCHSSFIHAVILALRSLILLPNTIIVRKNEPGNKMYFIAHGAVELLDAGQVYAVLKDGAYVGESALLDGLYR